jgi:hypothetical protein
MRADVQILILIHYSQKTLTYRIDGNRTHVAFGPYRVEAYIVLPDAVMDAAHAGGSLDASVKGVGQAQLNASHGGLG